MPGQSCRSFKAWIHLAGSIFLAFSMLSDLVEGTEAPVSEATQQCLECHQSATPVIVSDWKRSRHASVNPGVALKKETLARRVSSDNIAEKLSQFVVGCAECHTLNADQHQDSFDHNDVRVHLTVTPNDCRVCHATEVLQYEKNLMSYARHNLVENSVYMSLLKAVNGLQSFKNMKTTLTDPDQETNASSCLHCHGTELRVKGKRSLKTDYGDFEFPVLEGWPNQGVGRFNPDGSKGSCTSCHSRHQFSIKMARKPYTCSQCHSGPDVPAYKAYSVSKHGNSFSALFEEWDFDKVPWTVGKDFVAPTCATCHVSLMVDQNGDVVANRTHQMSDRLPLRILGLIYSHPHPKSPDTSLIRNREGLQLPTSLDGDVAREFLITAEEQKTRRETMQRVCRSCHGQGWVDGHWTGLENTRRTTDEMTRTTTEILKSAWAQGVADPNKSLFDEAIEKKWVEQWLFFGNSTRFAAAMMGADYGVFANGRWYSAKAIQEMRDHLKCLLGTKPEEGKEGKR